ncbi:hypothetical protein LMG23994_06985 [Cupriavidus pinatubonensis]|uniref:Uncharacterized protein n=1 Tax=Cupriavidus pinatubonensis TaxID=248026 RepID=A0ABM8Y434_9BURK|nr:hypothetical protein LMG23994_06985 [Cupriavidus pinatubonensis]
MSHSHEKSWSYAEITACTETAIRKVLFDDGRHAGGWQSKAVAYGVYVAWSEITDGHRVPGDDERLHKLVRAHNP